MGNSRNFTNTLGCVTDFRIGITYYSNSRICRLGNQVNSSRNVCDWTVHIEPKALELSEPNDANSRTLMSVNSLKLCDG